MQLREDHLELRRLIEVLADAAADASRQSPVQLGATTRFLLAKLHAHVAVDEQLSEPTKHLRSALWVGLPTRGTR